MFKIYIRSKLERYVKKYFKKHQPKLIVVVGAVGKTTTKTAIATVLSRQFRVQMEPENHNSEMSVPLAILGVKFPPEEMLRSISTWRKVFKACRQRIRSSQGVDVIIQELGTDHPGEIARYGKYLHADIAVVTSISAEHLANFENGIEDVAREELSVQGFTDMLMVNHDDIDPDFAKFVSAGNITDYGINGGEYRFQIESGDPLNGYQACFFAPEFGGASVDNPLLIETESEAPKVEVHLVGKHNIRAAVAAAAVAAKLGMSANDIADGIREIYPVAGRMNVLKGRDNSILIDDTYNASTSAVIAGLETLYEIGGEYTQRIAILGSMNEFGRFTKTEHEKVGSVCDPRWLDVVITIGDDAKNYLAPAAEHNGCIVKSFTSALDAGAYAAGIIRRSSQDFPPTIFIKGSQDKVYAEEATKILLASQHDDDKLVRQSPHWIAKKTEYFSSLENIAPDND